MEEPGFKPFGKFTVTTFKSPFSRCLNCLESFTRADSSTAPQNWWILAFGRKAELNK